MPSHVVHGLEPHPGRARIEPGGLHVDGADGLFQLVVVEERLGEAEDGVHAEIAFETGPVERGLQMADRLGGRGQEGGAAQFEEHARVDLGGRGLGQCAFQTAPGRVGRADGEVFAGGLAHLLDEFGVLVRVHFEEVAGRGGGAAP